MKILPRLLPLLFAALPAAAQVVNLEEPKNHGGFFCFAFSPDGASIAGGTGVARTTSKPAKIIAGGEALLWDAKTGRLRRTLGSHDETVRWIAFSANGATLVSGSRDNGLVKIWDAKTGALRQTLKAEGKLGESGSGTMTLCALSPDGKLLATVGVTENAVGTATVRAGDQLTVWDTVTGKPRWQLANSNVHALTFSPDGTTLAAALVKMEWTAKEQGATGKRSEQRFAGWDAATGKERFKVESTGVPEQLAYVPGSGLVAVDSGKLTFLDPATGLTTRKVKLAGGGSWRGTTFAPDGKTVVAARFMGEAVDWFDTASGKLVGSQEFKPEKLSHPVFSADLKRVACARAHDPIVFDLQPAPAAVP